MAIWFFIFSLVGAPTRYLVVGKGTGNGWLDRNYERLGFIERLKVLFLGNVFISILGGQPPVLLSVDDQSEELADEA